MVVSTGYINNYPLKWMNKDFRSNIRIAENENPGRYGCTLDDFKEGGSDLTLDVAAENIPERDAIVAAFMQQGRCKLGQGGVEEGWYQWGKTTSRSTSLKLSSIPPARYYPLNFGFKTEDPFFYSEKVHSRGVYVSTAGQQISADNCYPCNRAKNWDFENWGSATVTKPALVTPFISSINNYNFENWSSTGANTSVPSNWTRDTNYTGSNRSTDRVFGTYSLMIAGDGTNAIKGRITQAQTLVPGYYTISAFVKITGATQGTLHLDFNTASPVYTSTGLRVSANQDWTLITWRENITATNPTFRIYVDGTPNNGSQFLVDWVMISPDYSISGSEIENGALTQSFTLTTSQTLTYGLLETSIKNYDLATLGYTGVTANVVNASGVTTTKTVYQKSLTDNTFFIDLAGLTAGTYTVNLVLAHTNVLYDIPLNWVAGPNYRNVSKITSYSKYGTSSLAIMGDGSNAIVGDIFQYLNLEPGITYTFGIWARLIMNHSGILNFVLSDKDIPLASVTQTDNGDWTYLTFKYKFDTIPTNPKIQLYASNTPSANAYFILDGLVITEEDNYDTNVFGNLLTTDGTVNAIPDIEISGVGVGTTNSSIGPQVNTDSTIYDTTSTSYVLASQLVIAGVAGASILITDLRADIWSSNGSADAYVKFSIQGAGINGGNELYITPSNHYYTTNTTANSYTVTCPSLKSQANPGAPVTIRFYQKTESGYSATAHMQNCKTSYTGGSASVNAFPSDILVSNLAYDPFTKLQLVNTLYPGATFRVNANGSGYYKYFDSFDTNIYQMIASSMSGVTWDAQNSRIIIASGGYISYTFDTNFPIIGIPLLYLYVASGAPQLSICTNQGLAAGIMYNNDSSSPSPLSDVKQAYLLLNQANCTLNGSSNITVKIAPPTGSTLILNSIYFTTSLATVDCEIPEIMASLNSLYLLDMDNDAACFFTLIYPDRKWGI